MADDEWVEHHHDYLPDNTDIPLYGIRCVAVLDNEGKLGFSYKLDDPESLDAYQLASVLTVLRDQVLAEAATNWTVSPYAPRPENGDRHG